MILRRRRPLLTDTLPSSASTPRLRCKTTRTAGPSLARPAHTSRCNLSPAHSATPARRGRAESQRECTRGKEQSPSPWRGHRERCRHPHLHHGPALGVWEYPIGGHHSRLRPPATLAHRPARKGLPRTSRSARRARRATCASGSPPCACGAWPATGNFEAGRAPRDLAPAHRNLRHRRPGARGQAPSNRAGRVLSCLSGPPITLGAEQATRPGLPTGRVPVPVTQRHRHRRFEPCFGDLPRSAHSYGTDHSAPHPAPQARTDRITCCPATDAPLRSVDCSGDPRHTLRSTGLPDQLSGSSSELSDSSARACGLALRTSSPWLSACCFSKLRWWTSSTSKLPSAAIC